MANASNHKLASLGSIRGSESGDGGCSSTMLIFLLFVSSLCGLVMRLSGQRLKPQNCTSWFNSRLWEGDRGCDSTLFFCFHYNLLCVALLCGGVASVSTHKLASLSSTRGSEKETVDSVLFFSSIFTLFV